MPFMTHGAPHVLVVARFHNEEQADRVRRCLDRQTYREFHVVFIRRDDKKVPLKPESNLELCTAGGFAEYLEKSAAERVLFWPEEGDLKEAAIEKLVLALQVAPDQAGVGDAARGGTGLWLARRGEEMTSLITLWLGSQIKWIEECMRRKPNLFFIPENLSDAPDPAKLRRPYAVEHLFGKLPFRFESYQEIVPDPLWTLSEEKADDRSVLFLVSNLRMGGASKFILDLAGQLKAQGYRVTVATTGYDTENPNPWLEKLLEIVPEVFVLSNSRPVELPRLIVHLARTRRCGRIVLSHSITGYQLLPWLRLKLPEVSFLDYTHIEYETEWPNGGYALRSVNNQSLLDISMVSSEHLRQWMIERGAESEGLRVSHTNIDVNKWTPDPEVRASERNELGILPGTAMILYPSRLVEQKRPGLMCNIVAALRRNTKSPFVVVVAGDGPLQPALNKFVADQGLQENFRLLGAVSLERVARLHNASDILLLPSMIEGIALALFEAMALESVPVVADVGGQRELVTHDCGYLIPMRDARWEFADYVTVLRCLLQNPAMRREKAAACRDRVREHFQLSQMTAKFIAAMNEAGARHDSRKPQLPADAVCRELATLAIDQIRLKHEGGLVQEMTYLLQDQLKLQEKVIAKLSSKLKAADYTNPILEENEVAC